MAVELDGLLHIKNEDYNQVKTELLDSKNIIVIRFKNEEIIRDLVTVLNKLKVVITKRENDLEKD